MAQSAQDHHLRHAFGVRVGVFVAARNRDDIAARPHQCRVSHRHVRAAGRGFSYLGRLCRLLPQGLKRAGSGAIRFMSSLQTPPLSAGQGVPESRAVRLVRILLPIIVLAVGIASWELVVRVNDIPPYVLPGPSAVFQTLIDDWSVLSQSLMVTLWTTLARFVAAAFGGIALALLFNPAQWLGYS